jgi:UDP-glucose 4-epimerase
MGSSTSLLANLGSGSGYSVQEVIDAAGTFVDVPFAYAGRRPGDPAQLVASIQRARDVLGWGPRLDLHAILKTDYDFRKRLASRQARGI